MKGLQLKALYVILRVTMLYVFAKLCDMNEDIKRSREHFERAMKKALFITDSKVQAIDNDPNSDKDYVIAKDVDSITDVHVVKGYFEAQDIKGAIEECTEAIRFDPNYAEAYARRGVLRGYLGDPQGAEKDFETANTLFRVSNH
jgi:tetratricopeptide (TPR) repeat protein